MFRPRRPLRRPGLRRLAEAERLLRAGRWAEAAVEFETLGREAAARGRPDAAAEMAHRAALGYLRVGDLDRAARCADEAVDLWIRARRPGRLRQALPRVLAALEQNSRPEEAARLHQKALAAFPGLDMAAQPGTAGRHPPPEAAGDRVSRLPTRCPSCGGSLKPGEVAWADPATAECPYCGSLLRAA